MPSPLMQAINQISEEKNISAESVLETIEAALSAAYRKDFGEKDQNVKVKFDAETGEFEVFDVKTVVEDQELPEEDEETDTEERKPQEAPKARENEGAAKTGSSEEKAEGAEDDAPEEEKRFKPKTEIMISDAEELKKGAELGEEIWTKLDVPAAFGRMAAQTAKQVIIQKLREAERNKVFAEFKDQEGELVNATIQRREGRMVLIDVGHATAVMPPEEQIRSERYFAGDRIKVYVTDVRMTTKGPEIVVSRSHPEIVRRLFALEIPEIASGTVTIHDVAREAGVRSKVSVSSSDDTVDPIGSCIGQRGTRIQTIIAELGGEKIDIIQYDEDPYRHITNALSPAKIIDIELHEDERTADVLVAGDQLSLAIGKGGQNVRLASRLTGWRINVKESGADEGELAYEGEFPADEAAEGVPEKDDADEAAEGEEERESGGAAEDEQGDTAVEGTQASADDAAQEDADKGTDEDVADDADAQGTDEDADGDEADKA